MCTFPDHSLVPPSLKHEDNTVQWARALLNRLGAPDTSLTVDVTLLVRQVSPDWLFNHCVRTYLFAVQFAKLEQIRFDFELLYASSMLHDLGLTSAAEGQGRFEVDGAEVAYRFVKDRGLTENKATAIWTAIVLHNSLGIGDRNPCAEARLVYHAVNLDGWGLRSDEFSPTLFEETFIKFPRLRLLNESINTMIEQVRKDARKAPPFTMHAALAEAMLPGYKMPNIMDLMGVDFWEQYNE